MGQITNGSAPRFTHAILPPEGFKGYVMTTYDPAADEVGYCAPSTTLAAYEAARNEGKPLRVVPWSLIEQWQRQRWELMETVPAPVTYERFTEMLEVLPPARWRTVRGVEMFHVIEHLDGPLVSWFAMFNGQAFEFVGRHDADAETIASRVRGAWLTMDHNP